ncbi:PD-(D/E)XK nuclease-like domain-containing protein [Actinoplanes oblitus]|uniref:PD-(D/E)XK nuclease-like domain-containing protein n=1 Tax=Actinoplanes oblitus TaxID=3040509 RepID=A0ABY8WIW6_9ACTN|nr:PD-(D/E)XK nuclease-like domain-containing protein [Actinoplanes oblitus]WIM97811.1 PD-(D/E)XK nuclease-like domain-containing protein [Actinoplanes oblitus]
MSAPTLPPSTKVTGPGVYQLTEAEYHADPVPGGSLSSTGARMLIAPSCPALYRHWADSPQETTDYFDFGSAAHQLVLGVGPGIHEVKADSWRTNKAKQDAADARERGETPLLSRDVKIVEAMAARLREHPIARALFAPGSGRAEQAIVWQAAGQLEDGRTVPVRCRALIDWLRHPGAGRLLVPDYKTCASAAPDDAMKSVARLGYHVQGAFYLAGLRALGLADDSARFLLVMQEKTAPYLVTVIEPDQTAMRLGAMRVREAIDIYARCTESGRWPGYSDDVVIGELPPWETKELNGEIW